MRYCGFGDVYSEKLSVRVILRTKSSIVTFTATAVNNCVTSADNFRKFKGERLIIVLFEKFCSCSDHIFIVACIFWVMPHGCEQVHISLSCDIETMVIFAYERVIFEFKSFFAYRTNIHDNPFYTEKGKG